MGNSALHPSGTRGSRTDPTLTFATKDRGPGIEPPHDHRAVALFIGGAGDKKSYYLAGPYRNIAYALSACGCARGFPPTARCRAISAGSTRAQSRDYPHNYLLSTSAH